MPYRRRPHWATLLAVGLPLLITGCAGTSTRYGMPGDPSAEQSANANLNAMSLADKLRAEKNYSSAAAMYQQAHQSNPHDVRPLLGMGESFLAIGANIDAANAFSAALNIASDNPEALFGLGKARILLNQPELAVPVLQAAARLVPNDPRPLTALGVAQDKVGDHPTAQKSYKTVLGLDPNNRAALNNLALSLALSGDETGSIKILEDLNKSATASSVTRQNLALVYGVNGQMEQSERLGRVDLSEPNLQQNLLALGATSSPTDRQALLKSALGVELSGMQYAAASRPTAIPPAPAQLPVDESAGYVPPPNNGEMQIITVETKKLSSSTKTNGAAVARSVVTEDEWGDDWDEELVDASELAPTSPGAANPPAAQAPRIAATAPGAADDALPDAPRPAGSATTLAANDSSAQMIAPTETMSPASAPTGAGQPAVKASDQPATEANAPTSAQDVSTPARMISITPPPTTSTAIAELKSTPASAATTSQSSPTASPATAVALASSKPATTQPTESTAVVATTESGGAKMYTVQLAAYRSEAEASAGWMALTTDQGDLLNGLPHHVEKADLGADKGIFFRLKTGTFDDIAKAKALCTDLKTRSIDCMVVEATSTAAPASSTQSKQSAVTPSNPIVVGARY